MIGIIWLTIFLYIFRGFCVYCVPLPPLRGQHMVLCHPRWLPTSGLTEFAMCCEGAGFEPRTTDLQSGALPLSHLSSLVNNWLTHPSPCWPDLYIIVWMEDQSWRGSPAPLPTDLTCTLLSEWRISPGEVHPHPSLLTSPVHYCLNGGSV
jgi:hypothetical protein